MRSLGGLIYRCFSAVLRGPFTPLRGFEFRREHFFVNDWAKTMRSALSGAGTSRGYGGTRDWQSPIRGKSVRWRPGAYGHGAAHPVCVWLAQAPAVQPADKPVMQARPGGQSASETHGIFVSAPRSIQMPAQSGVPQWWTQAAKLDRKSVV